MQLVVGVTGHRDLVAAEKPEIERRVRTLFADLSRQYPDLELEVLTALAEGADSLVARVAVDLGIPFSVVLPMQSADYEKDFDTGAGLAEFQSLLAQASRVIELSPGDRPISRNSLYAQAGLFISNHCQVLLALWDGKPNGAVGGTSQVVNYHLTGVMEGFEGALSQASLLADNENDLVYHVVCSRDRQGGAPAAGLSALEAEWFSSRNDGERTTEIPDAYRMQLGRLQRFALDWKEKEPVLGTSSPGLLGENSGLDMPAGARETDALFRAADSLAIHYQQRVNSSLRALHILAILMGLVFLVYTEFDGPGYMVLTFLGLFFAGVVVHLIGSNREWHRKYLDYRALAEGLRVQLYWNLSGVVDSSSAGFAYDNFLQTQDVDLGWIRHVMRQASIRRIRGRATDPAWVKWVIDEWIGEPVHGRGQLAWYSHKQMYNTSRFRRTQILGNLCLWTGIGIAILLYLTDADSGGQYRQWLLVLMGVLPLVAGIWDTYSHKKAEKELIKQYGFMSRVFQKARKLVDHSDDIAFQRLVLKALGQAALDEGAEWLLMHRERPMEHGRL